MRAWQKLLIVLILLFAAALVFGMFSGSKDLVSEARHAAATCLTGRGTCSELHPDRTASWSPFPLPAADRCGNGGNFSILTPPGSDDAATTLIHLTCRSSHDQYFLVTVIAVRSRFSTQVDAYFARCPVTGGCAAATQWGPL